MSKPKEFLFRCSCHDYHFLQFTWYPEDTSDTDLGVEGYASVGGDFWRSLPDRMKAAWKVLRGRHANEMDVILDAEKADDLKRVIELYLADVRRK